MDADSGEGQQEAMRAVDTVNGQSDKGRDESKTYASVAAQSTLHGSSAKSPSAIIDEEAEVVEVSNQQGDALQDVVVQDQQVLQPPQSKSDRVVANSNGPKKNATYLESNPEKKNRSTAPGTGSHDAIVITEQGAIENGASGSKGRRSHNVGLKRVLGTIGRNLKGRRLAETRELNGREVSEFINELSGHLDNLQDPILHHPSSADRAMDVGDIRIDDAEDVSSDSDSRYNEDHGVDMVSVAQNGDYNFQLTVVYASPNAAKRKHVWQHLTALEPSSDIPWVLGGDFNSILSAEDRNRNMAFVRNGSRLFNDFLFQTGLTDLGFSGLPYTWSRGRLSQRLDHFLGNTTWLSAFSQASMYHLDRLGSDHCPIVLRLMAPTPISVHRSFYYLDAWNEHPTFNDFLSSVWEPNGSLLGNIENFKLKATSWKVEVFSYIREKKKRLRARIRGIDRVLNQRHSDSLVILGRKLRSELETVLDQEENLWRQKACSDCVEIYVLI
ncbi:hypothetical protein V6N13_113792 [Hibiscus sabdariffa]